MSSITEAELLQQVQQALGGTADPEGAMSVKELSKATKSVWLADINEFIELSISPFLVKILLLICPNVSPVPSTFADILF